MGRVKTKKARNIRTSPSVPLFLAPLTFARDSRENENYPRSQSREDGRTGFYKFVSLRVRKSVQKGDRTSNEKNANTRL